MERVSVDRPDVNRDQYRGLPRHSLILCASLVQNPANLGGLCRLAEVFRLESMVISDLAIAQTPPFRKLSASAHHWQPLLAVSEEMAPDWWEQKRREGYRIIALDTDTTAIPLTTFHYPQKSVLILGRELTGLSKAWLERCDDVVTIPQFGLVESLNVQNAAAIAVYEYMCQWESLLPVPGSDSQQAEILKRNEP